MNINSNYVYLYSQRSNSPSCQKLAIARKWLVYDKGEFLQLGENAVDAFIKAKPVLQQMAKKAKVRLTFGPDNASLLVIATRRNLLLTAIDLFRSIKEFLKPDEEKMGAGITLIENFNSDKSIIKGTEEAIEKFARNMEKLRQENVNSLWRW